MEEEKGKGRKTTMDETRIVALGRWLPFLNEVHKHSPLGRCRGTVGGSVRKREKRGVGTGSFQNPTFPRGRGGEKPVPS